jgi:hypothetical protein
VPSVCRVEKRHNLRTPRAPCVGDYDKALKHMQHALAIEPRWLESQLSMAEVEFRLGTRQNDPALTTSAHTRLQGYFLKAGVKPRMAMGSAYEFAEWQTDARKLMDEYKQQDLRRPWMIGRALPSPLVDLSARCA